MMEMYIYKAVHHLQDLDADGRKILTHIYRIYEMGVQTGLSWLRIVFNGRCL
jgi:hypothetical protein